MNKTTLPSSTWVSLSGAEKLLSSIYYLPLLLLRSLLENRGKKKTEESYIKDTILSWDMKDEYDISSWT